MRQCISTQRKPTLGCVEPYKMTTGFDGIGLSNLLLKQLF
jgi:hypothetical protein